MPDNEPRSETVQVQMTPTMKRAVVAEAERVESSSAQVIRQCVKEGLEARATFRSTWHRSQG